MAHPVVHFEVIGKDLDTLRGFYGDLFGWKLQVLEEMPYALVEKEEPGIGGGLGVAPDGGPGFVTFYVGADDPQATVDRATELGGTVVMPVTDLGMVTIALISDPEGHVVGIVQNQQ
jgi:predicted enzyme related to lactoylglutathione lyase